VQVLVPVAVAGKFLLHGAERVGVSRPAGLLLVVLQQNILRRAVAKGGKRIEALGKRPLRLVLRMLLEHIYQPQQNLAIKRVAAGRKQQRGPGQRLHGFFGDGFGANAEKGALGRRLGGELHLGADLAGVGAGNGLGAAREQVAANSVVGRGPLGCVAGLRILAAGGQRLGLGGALAQHAGHDGSEALLFH
nr:hypothetical protein [Tanacetum cinerariifolium]